jgi:hypothetical protein
LIKVSGQLMGPLNALSLLTISGLGLIVCFSK